MFWFLMTIWFTDAGVALGQWGLGGFSNPAAYATGNLQLSSQLQQSWIRWSLSAWGQGVEASYDTLTQRWRIGLPSAFRFGPVALGGRYEQQGKDINYDIGTLIRPSPYLSLGAVLQIAPQEDTLRVGMGLRPLDGWILWGDGWRGLKQPASLKYNVGTALRLYRSLWVGGMYDGEDVWGGVGFALDNWVFHAHGNFHSRRIQGGISWIWPRPAKTLLPSRHALIWNVQTGVRETPYATWWGHRTPSFTEELLTLDSLLHRPDVPAILIKFRETPWNYAQSEEIRRVLADARRRGKKIWVYAENLGLRGLYVASVAHRLFIHPEGMVTAPGVYLERLFLKGTLEKLGIEVEADRIGKYKSAVEMLTRENMSKADSVQHARYLQDLWEEVVGGIAEGRGMLPEEVADLLLSRGVFTAEEALAAGLVDEIRYEDQVDSLFRKNFGRLVTLRWHHKVQEEGWGDRRPVIAVVVAEGDIILGKTAPPSPVPLPFLSGPTVGSWSQKALWDRLRRDPRIKAVVFRIDSPGGSAQASEDIWREVRRTVRSKPVVVSMGRVAASGGYYIAAGASRIYADATTVTGSIGILWIKPVLAGFYAKLGVSRDVVKIGEHADAFSPWRGYDEEERTVVHRLLQEGYQTFLRRVSHGRNLTVDGVDAVAQGRIWSGRSARDIGLVDAIGGVREAVEEAARLAGVRAYRVEVFPVFRRSILPWTHGEATWAHRLGVFLSEPYLYRAPVDTPGP